MILGRTVVSVWFYFGFIWVRDGRFRGFLMGLVILGKIAIFVLFFRFDCFGYFFC